MQIACKEDGLTKCNRLSLISMPWAKSNSNIVISNFVIKVFATVFLVCYWTLGMHDRNIKESINQSVMSLITYVQSINGEHLEVRPCFGCGTPWNSVNGLWGEGRCIQIWETTALPFFLKQWTQSTIMQQRKYHLLSYGFWSYAPRSRRLACERAHCGEGCDCVAAVCGEDPLLN